MSVCFILIATGKYIEFVEPFVKSTEKYFLPSSDKFYFILTDGCYPPTFHCKLPLIEHLPFPLPTLLRFHRFLQLENEILHCWNDCSDVNKIKEVDYLAYSDIDNLWVSKVEPEDVLSPLSATLHCGYIGGGTDFDQNPKSLAYFPTDGTENYKYYAGGFILATPEEYFRMARWCAERINDDLSKNVIAKWHDESHLNKYLNTIRRPEKELIPSFHFAEYLLKNDAFKEKYPPKLLLLDKKHEEIRKIEYKKSEYENNDR